VVSFRDEKKKFSVGMDEINKELIEKWAREFKERFQSCSG